MKKTIIWISVITLILLSSTALFYQYVVNRDFFFNDIQTLVKEDTGYTITKSGSLEFSLMPRPTLILRDFTATNFAAPSSPTIAEIESLSILLQWSPLLQRQLVVDLEIEAININFEVDTQGQPNWVTKELLAATDDPLPFQLDKINVSETRFDLNNRQTNEILGFDLEQLDIDLTSGVTSAHIDSAGQSGGFRFIVVGDVAYKSGNDQLDLMLNVEAGKAQGPNLDAVEVSSTSLPLHGLIQGSLSIEEMAPQGELAFEVSVEALDDFIYLADELKYLNKGLGPATASGVLQLNRSDFDIADFQLGLHQNQLDMEAEGHIQNLLSDVQVDLNIKLRAESLRAVVAAESVEGYVEQLVSQTGPVDISASVSREAGDILISELDLEFAYNSLTTEIGGDLHFMQDDLLFNLDILGEATDGEDLLRLLDVDTSRLIDRDFHEFGSLNVSASISGRQDSYQIDHVSAVLHDSNVKTTMAGDIGYLDGDLTFDLGGSLAIEDFSKLAMLFPSEYESPLRGLSGSAKSELKGTLENFSLHNMEIDFVREGQQLQLRGQLSQLPEDPKPNIGFRFVSSQPVELERYFPKLVDLQLTGPLELKGTIIDADQKIRVQDIRLLAEQTDVQGNIVIDRDDSPPRVTVVFGSEQLINPLFRKDSEAAPPETDQDLTSESESQTDVALSGEELSELFKAYTAGVKLETDWIDNLNLYFRYTARKAQLGVYNVEDLAITIDARDGLFELVEYKILLDGELVSVNGLIDINPDTPSYRVAGTFKGDTIEALIGLEEDVFVGGALNGDFRFTSRGDYLGEVIENLGGEALVTMGPLSIRSNALTSVSTSIFSSMLEGVMSKKEGEPTSHYQCGVLGVEVENGVAKIDNAFTLQAERYNLAGTGEIDFNTGFVDISAAPRARTGLGLSVSTLVGGFTISGHMATPDFGVGGAFVSAVVTGYLLAPSVAAVSASNPVTASIIATGFFAKGLFERMTASRYTCENTIKRIEER